MMLCRKTGMFAAGAVLLMTVSLLLVVISALGSVSAQDTTGGSVVSENMTINATIDNNYAVTTLSQTLTNKAEADSETTISYTIPDGAFLSLFRLTIDGVTYTSRVVEKEAAQEEYDSAKESGKTASIVESSSSTTVSSFTYKINLKSGQSLIYELVYEEYIPRTKGTYTYVIPLSRNSFPAEGGLSFYVELESIAGFNDIAVPNYPGAAVEHLLGTRGTVNYSPDHRSFAEDLTVVYSVLEYPPEGFFMNYEIGNEGYFFHVFCPEMDDIGGSSMAKDIVFVIDRSGSMSGDKIKQARDAFSSIVDDLGPSDRFNIIVFDDSIETFRSSLVEASDNNIDKGKDYIKNTEDRGGTDINEAMLKGLDILDSESGNVPIICFLTDGQPTSGTTDLKTIRGNILDNNDMGAAIFCLGFGSGCDIEFLQAISMENNGHATRILTNKDASDQIVGYYDTFSTPLVTKISFDYGPGSSDVFPTYVPALYQGSEVVVVGRYDPEMVNLRTTVLGETSDGEQDFSKTFDIQERTENSFIPRYWGSEKIKDLMDQMIVDGETQQLKDNITQTALDYQFVTPYTSMILVVEEPAEESSSSNEGNEWETEDEEDEQRDDDPADPDDYVQPPLPDDDDDIPSPQPYSPPSAGGYPGDDDDDSDDSGANMMLISGICVVAIIVVVAIILVIIGAGAGKKIPVDREHEKHTEKDNNQ